MRMIEKVARAMAENAGFKWENCAQSQWMSDARAGIAAMREPTEDMTQLPSYYLGDWSRRNVEAFIDAALADETNLAAVRNA